MQNTSHLFSSVAFTLSLYSCLVQNKLLTHAHYLKSYIQKFMIELETSSGNNNDKHNKHLKGTLDEALQAVLEFND